MALERGRHVDIVRGVSLQHLILRDQALRALGKEHLVAELDGGLHLAAFDQIGMWLEDRIYLLCWELARRAAPVGAPDR